MKQILKIGLSFIVILMSGCAAQKTSYQYSDYSKSFYHMKQNGNSETTAEWKNTLEESIEKSNSKALRIPPGINANLGYIYLNLSDTDKAISYFEAEKALYPEATVFMDKLIKKAEIMKEGKGKS